MCSIAVYLQRKHDLTWLDLYGVQTCFRELRLTASPGHRFKTRFAASSIYLEV